MNFATTVALSEVADDSHDVVPLVLPGKVPGSPVQTLQQGLQGGDHRVLLVLSDAEHDPREDLVNISLHQTFITGRADTLQGLNTGYHGRTFIQDISEQHFQ